MNKVELIGRLTRDPDIRYSQSGMAVARYTLAVDRRGKDKGADFIGCIAFDKGAEFAEKYLKKGTKIAIVGHIVTNNYTDRDGRKVYATDIVVDEHEFVESKKQEPANDNGSFQDMDTMNEGFMAIPEGADDTGLPFN